VNRPRAADDFTAIRARMVELRRERERGRSSAGDLRADPPAGRNGTDRWSPEKISEWLVRVRQSGSITRLGQDRGWWARHE
jgi:hypothetical protein